MNIGMTRKGAATLSAALCFSFTIGITTLYTGCGANPSEYKNPAPAISAFMTGTLDNGGHFEVTKIPNSLKVANGGSAWFRANFGVKGGTAVVTPGNKAVQSNVPFQITNITASTTYTLTVTSEDGQKTTATCSLTVMNTPASLTYANEDATYYVGVQIPANTPTVSGDAPITYSVDTTDPFQGLPAGFSLDATTGAITGTPQVTSAQTTYRIKAKNDVGDTTRDIKIAVAATPLIFSAAPTSITVGEGTMLSWNASSVAGLFSQVDITASPADATLTGPFGLSGTKNVSPIATTTYTLSATPAAGGPAVTKMVDITVGAAPVRFTSFTATPTWVPFGASSTLAWTYTGIPLDLTLDGVNVLGSLSKDVTPMHRQTFTLAGSNLIGNDSAQVTVAARGLDLLAGAPGGGGMRDGMGRWASFTAPQSIASDGSGNLYVADVNNNIFRKITADGTVTTIAGRYGVSGNADSTGADPLTATFKSPRGVFPDSNGYIWLCDSGNALLRVITPAKDVKTITGLGWTTAAYSPNQIVITSNNGTTAVGYLADYKAGLVKVTINLGALTGTSSVIAGFSGPSGIGADANGIVYCLDTNNGAVKAVKNDVVYPLTGHGLTFSAPYGVATITSGTTTQVFVAEPGTATTPDNAVYRFTVNNSGNPTAVAASGIVLAGSAVIGAADGTGDVATFAGPNGIAIVGTTAYVVDAKNRLATPLPPSLPGTSVVQVYSNTVRALSNVKDATANTQVTVSTFAGASRIAANANVPTTGTATLANARFNNPQGMAVDASRNIYLADTGNNVIRKITPAGIVSNYPNDATTFATPYMVAVDTSQNVYVLERGATACTIQMVSPAGVVTAIPAAGLSAKCGGIAVDSTGTYLYITDVTAIKQVKIADASVVSSTATFSKLVGLTLDGSNGIYAVDGSIIKYIADMTAAAATTIAGTTSGYLDSSDATTAKLNQPNGIAYFNDGGQGYLYVSDFYNSALRMITLGSPAAITTLIGKPNATGGTAGVVGALPGRIEEDVDATHVDGGLYRPQAVAVTPSGDILLTTNDTIMQASAPLKK